VTVVRDCATSILKSTTATSYLLKTDRSIAHFLHVRAFILVDEMTRVVSDDLGVSDI
jgi:hypothetical protein